MAMLSTGPVRLHYLQRGDPRRPRVVLVHGLATNTAFWFPQVFPGLARDHRVTAYDLRGHGRSAMPAAGYRIEDMAADLDAVVRHQGAGPVHLIGHSYGGAVALAYTVRCPDRVASLVVADSRLATFQSNDPLAAWLDADDDAEDGRPGPSALMGPSGVSARTADRWRTLLDTTGVRADVLSAAGPAVADLAAVRQPVLAVYGERSDFLPSCRALRRHVRACRTVVVPRAGHFHPYARPEVFLGAVREFLAGSAVAKERAS